MLDISIIIVNWNAKDYLRDCLDSITRNSGGLNLEIIVVDNASTDGTSSMVKAQFPSVILIENKDNRGYGSANNQAIRISKGKYVLVLNPDTIIFEGSIRNLMEFLEQNPKAGAVGPKILNPDGSVQFECARNFPTPMTEFYGLTTLYKRFPGSRFFGKYLISYWNHEDMREVELLSGACFLVRKTVFDGVGLFDEDFFMYTEETDLFYRIRERGWKVYFLPSAKIKHLWGKSTEQLPYVMAIEARRSMELFFLKHYGLFTAIFHRLIVALSALFLSGCAIVGYLFSNKEGKQKNRNIFLRNFSMLLWSVGLK